MLMVHEYTITKAVLNKFSFAQKYFVSLLNRIVDNFLASSRYLEGTLGKRMACSKQHLCKEIITEVQHFMRLKAQSEMVSGRPNYKWLSQTPKLSEQQKQELELLAMKIDETECKTAIANLQMEIQSRPDILPHEVPKIMCLILQQLAKDKETINMFRASKERRSNMHNEQNSVQTFPQESIQTVSGILKNNI